MFDNHLLADKLSFSYQSFPSWGKNEDVQLLRNCGCFDVAFGNGCCFCSRCNGTFVFHPSLKTKYENGSGPTIELQVPKKKAGKLEIKVMRKWKWGDGWPVKDQVVHHHTSTANVKSQNTFLTDSNGLIGVDYWVEGFLDGKKVASAGNYQFVKKKPVNIDDVDAPGLKP